MRKPIPILVKEQMRRDVIASCRNPTGFPNAKHPENGCGVNPECVIGDALRECACFDLFRCMHKHGDYGFNPQMFRHSIEDLQFHDRSVLDGYLKDPKVAWAGKGLYIHSSGSIGCGKTTLAHLVTRYLYAWKDKHARGDYHAWYMLSHEFADRSWRGRDGFKEQIQWSDSIEDIDLWSVDLFVLDEFGREGAYDERKVAAGRSLFESFLRERAYRPTIIVSHIAPKDVGRMMGDQTVSLLSDMAVVELVGEDRRGAKRSPFRGDE